jgi:hypothetical protein
MLSKAILKKIAAKYMDPKTMEEIMQILADFNISNNNVVSIFTPENEKHINEHILNFVIKNKKESNILDTSFFNVCLNNIKSYLKLKKISKNDTETFKKRYNEIYEIVIKNQAN